MTQAFDTQRIISKTNQFDQEGYLLSWAEGFLLDRKVRGLSEGTLRFYKQKLDLFLTFADSREITQVKQITPTELRLYLVSLEEEHNPGGILAAYRAVRAFLNWYEAEVEPEDWTNPIDKVATPKAPLPPLKPVEIQTVKALIKVCEKGTYTGDRDRAMLLALLDTGARASEFLALDLEDVDRITGKVLIRSGKGDKPRTVFLGRTSRKALRRYLKHRAGDNRALWLGTNDERLTYWGLRSVVKRRAKKANVDAPTLHSFRRAFAINSLRNGIDVFSLQELMGHADTQVLKRYLKQTTEDLEKAHRATSPVDRSF
jgi:integrase/recombinase XerD